MTDYKTLIEKFKEVANDLISDFDLNVEHYEIVLKRNGIVGLLVRLGDELDRFKRETRAGIDLVKIDGLEKNLFDVALYALIALSIKQINDKEYGKLDPKILPGKFHNLQNGFGQFTCTVYDDIDSYEKAMLKENVRANLAERFLDEIFRTPSCIHEIKERYDKAREKISGSAFKAEIPVDVEASFSSSKVEARKFIDLLESGNVSNVGTSIYWNMIYNQWNRLKKSMGETLDEQA